MLYGAFKGNASDTAEIDHGFEIVCVSNGLPCDGNKKCDHEAYRKRCGAADFY